MKGRKAIRDDVRNGKRSENLIQNRIAKRRCSAIYLKGNDNYCSTQPVAGDEGHHEQQPKGKIYNDMLEKNARGVSMHVAEGASGH